MRFKYFSLVILVIATFIAFGFEMGFGFFALQQNINPGDMYWPMVLWARIYAVLLASVIFFGWFLYYKQRYTWLFALESFAVIFFVGLKIWSIEEPKLSEMQFRNTITTPTPTNFVCNDHEAISIGESNVVVDDSFGRSVDNWVHSGSLLGTVNPATKEFVFRTYISDSFKTDIENKVRTCKNSLGQSLIDIYKLP